MHLIFSFRLLLSFPFILISNWAKNLWVLALCDGRGRNFSIFQKTNAPSVYIWSISAEISVTKSQRGISITRICRKTSGLPLGHVMLFFLATRFWSDRPKTCAASSNSRFCMSRRPPDTCLLSTCLASHCPSSHALLHLLRHPLSPLPAYRASRGTQGERACEDATVARHLWMSGDCSSAWTLLK